MGGDPGSILTVLSTTKKEFPMPLVVFKGTGGAADLLAYAIRLKFLMWNMFSVSAAVMKFLFEKFLTKNEIKVFLVKK